ncbi:hypothetical protein HOLleu_27323 [Holothuria leucospilota]|uniref:P2X purinoreceptor 7 intracellular domain-containing protein n=1 Tax=Holothuria leucospilota TaxID=206669 RepID=A0A9Q1BQE6_HOLLE|nr:hypothetical protein HOLleu_27323 [Holothuria leucospilota]
MEGPRPYDFEPLLEEGEGGGRNVEEEFELESDDEIELEEARLGNNAWCMCGFCTAMPTITECRCCNEGRAFQPFLIEGTTCVTLHEEFAQVCLAKPVLRATLIMRNDIRGHTGSTMVFSVSFGS